MNKTLWVIITTFLVSSAIFYGYYFFFNPFKLQLLYQSWDGPAYVVVSRSFYDPELIGKNNTIGLPENYFVNYFPLYPLFIKLFSFVGYFQSSILVSQIFTLIFIISIYYLIKRLYPKSKLNWIAIPLIFFPARWFSITHIGSSEPLFLFLISMFLIYFLKGKHLHSSIFLSLAQLTRHAAIWFFAGIVAYLFFEWITKKKSFKDLLKILFPYLLVPITLILVNFFFYLKYQDLSFLSANLKKASYFQLIPYNIFNSFTGGVWQESFIFTYLFYLGGIILLFKDKKYSLGFLATFNYIPLIFLVQEDLSRIALSGLPLMFLAYNKFITNKAFQLALLLLTPAIYMFSIHFLNYNISP